MTDANIRDIIAELQRHVINANKLAEPMVSVTFETARKIELALFEFKKQLDTP